MWEASCQSLYVHKAGNSDSVTNLHIGKMCFVFSSWLSGYLSVSEEGCTKLNAFYLVAGQRIVTRHIHLWPHKINVTVSSVLSLLQPVVLTEPARLHISAEICEQVRKGGFHTRAMHKEKEHSDLSITLGAAAFMQAWPSA